VIDRKVEANVFLGVAQFGCQRIERAGLTDQIGTQIEDRNFLATGRQFFDRFVLYAYRAFP